MINTNINNYPKTANDHDVAPKVEKSPEEIKQNKTSAPTITQHKVESSQLILQKTDTIKDSDAKGEQKELFNKNLPN